jgi:phage terminase large subunit-like protein
MVQAAAADAKVRIRYREVRASRGKVVRAEPIAALYETGRVHHVGHFPELEDQLVAFSTHGYLGDGSPDRADALIWSLTELFPCVVASEMPFEKKPEVLGSLLWRRRSLTEMAKSCAEVADEIVDLINR